MPGKFRRSLPIILALVAATHVVFVADYWRLTDGCFCAVDGVGVPIHRTVLGEYSFFRLIGAPTRLLPVPFSAWIPNSMRIPIIFTVNGAVWFAFLALLVALALKVSRRPLDNDGNVPRPVLANER